MNDTTPRDRSSTRQELAELLDEMADLLSGVEQACLDLAKRLGRQSNECSSMARRLGPPRDDEGSEQ
jgi:hypothetical protein